MLNYYQILGVPEDASSDEIKSAFKKQALKFHPDRNLNDPASEELFKEINTAYQTLSNPYNRHKYDMTLKFGSFDIPEQPHYQEPPRYRRRPRPRPFYKAPPITSKENLQATLYAFLFAFFVGLIIKTGIWTTEYYRAIEHEKLLTERRLEFDKAQSAFDAGELKESLLILDDLGMFFDSEFDMKEFKEMLLSTVLTRANNSMDGQDYTAALRYYSILDNFSNGNSINILLNKAEAYKGLGDYQQAIEMYQLLYFNGYRSLGFYIEMGELYATGLKDYESALNYFRRAGELAAQEYEAVFGKAYPVMINGKLIPKFHFSMFMKLADTYYQVGDYEGSLKSLIWTKEIWPDSSENYLISAKSHLALGEQLKACLEFKQAKKLDNSLDLPSICD